MTPKPDGASTGPGLPVLPAVTVTLFTANPPAIALTMTACSPCVRNSVPLSCPPLAPAATSAEPSTTTRTLPPLSVPTVNVYEPAAETMKFHDIQPPVASEPPELKLSQVGFATGSGPGTAVPLVAATGGVWLRASTPCTSG